MGTGAGTCDYCADGSAINDCRGGSGTGDRQAETDGQILSVGCGGDLDGIARRSERDGMPDGLAGGRGRRAVVGVIPPDSVYLSCRAG